MTFFWLIILIICFVLSIKLSNTSKPSTRKETGSWLEMPAGYTGDDSVDLLHQLTEVFQMRLWLILLTSAMMVLCSLMLFESKFILVPLYIYIAACHITVVIFDSVYFVRVRKEEIIRRNEEQERRKKEQDIKLKIDGGDKEAMLNYVMELLTGQYFPSFDPERVKTTRYFFEVYEWNWRLGYGKLDGKKMVVVMFFPQPILYCDSRRRSMQKIREDHRLQSCHDCWMIYKCIFSDELLEKYIDIIALALTKKKKDGESFMDVVGNDYSNIQDYCLFSREQYLDISDDFCVERILEAFEESKHPNQSKVILQERYLVHEDKNVGNGYIYILINPSMEGLVKIGKTTRTPEERAKEMSDATGVPTPFLVLYKEQMTPALRYGVMDERNLCW